MASNKKRLQGLIGGNDAAPAAPAPIQRGAPYQISTQISPVEPELPPPASALSAPLQEIARRYIGARIAAVQELGESRGEIRSVKVTLIGRPGTIVEKKDVVLTAMTSMKAPALPKGLPTPPTTPTTYVVYIARKQWAGVAAALENPEDALIIEGWAVYDAELEGIAVFAMQTTTRLLQAAKRQQQASA